MNKLILMTFALTISLSAACVVENPQDKDWDIEECGEKCEPQEQPELSATFVSGHLGNYRDCPGDGYKSGDNTGGSEPADGDADYAPGACAEGEECPHISNCEDAQVTIQLSNSGDAAATGLQVVTIELFDADGVLRATLPLMDAVDTATYETFGGRLEVGEEVTLRVEFQGPQNAHTLLDTSSDGDAPSSGDRASGSHGIIEVTLSADNHDDVAVETSELYPVPSVDT